MVDELQLLGRMVQEEERWNDGEDKVPLRATEHGEKLSGELVEPLQLVMLQDVAAVILTLEWRGPCAPMKASSREALPTRRWKRLGARASPGQSVGKRASDLELGPKMYASDLEQTEMSVAD
eukprot:Skav202694  [mRNA]  locus=scaffold654:85029:90261:- [translate_table: standard]